MECVAGKSGKTLQDVLAGVSGNSGKFCMLLVLDGGIGGNSGKDLAPRAASAIAVPPPTGASDNTEGNEGNARCVTPGIAGSSGKRHALAPFVECAAGNSGKARKLPDILAGVSGNSMLHLAFLDGVAGNSGRIQAPLVPGKGLAPRAAGVGPRALRFRVSTSKKVVPNMAATEQEGRMAVIGSCKRVCHCHCFLRHYVITLSLYYFITLLLYSCIIYHLLHITYYSLSLITYYLLRITYDL